MHVCECACVHACMHMCVRVCMCRSYLLSVPHFAEESRNLRLGFFNILWFLNGPRIFNFAVENCKLICVLLHDIIAFELQLMLFESSDRKSWD